MELIPTIIVRGAIQFPCIVIYSDADLSAMILGDHVRLDRNDHNIPTELLRTFVAVCDLGSFTKAAQLLEMSRPAVSTQIKRLESMFGAELTRKSAAEINLTSPGSEVLKSARQFLSANDRMVAQCGAEIQPALIRVGIPNVFAGSHLPKIVSEFQKRAPDAKLQICCDGSRDILRSIRNGYLDIALAFGDADDMIDAERSWPEELVWVKGPGLQYDRNKPVPYISSPSPLIMDRVATSALDQSNQSYQITYSAYEFGARMAGAASGLGYLAAPIRLVPPGLTIEDPHILPQLPNIMIGIFTSGTLRNNHEQSLVVELETIVRQPYRARAAIYGRLAEQATSAEAVATLRYLEESWIVIAEVAKIIDGDRPRSSLGAEPHLFSPE